MQINPMMHQAKGVEFLARNRGMGALYWEVGCGKTIGSLMAYSYFKEATPDLKLLIICPLSLIEGAWIKEIDKFFPQLTWINLHSKTGKIKSKNQIFNADIHIINFEYLISKNKFDELKVLLKQNLPMMCVIDESSKMKNHESKTTERILELACFFKHRIIMSGTPAPNIEWEYWAQMAFLNPDIFDRSFHKFKNTYFCLRRGTQAFAGQYLNKNALREMFKQGFKYQIIPEKRPALLDRMRPFCDFVSARDCMDLPDEIDEYRILDMTKEQTDIYQTMAEQCILELKQTQSYAVANIALTRLMKLRQITAGFVIDEFGAAVKVIDKNPKMDALTEIIEECGDEQIIIWGQFHCEIEEIVRLLDQYGQGVSVLYGKIPQGDRINHINRFIDRTNRFLVAHPDSAAHGLTFVNCRYQVFFSLSYSFEEYSQARGRTMRYGQKNNCVYFHLLAKDSIDNDVLAIVQKKATTAEIAEKYLKGV